jgi:uncharacterized protein YegP (UPF0339 family)
LSKPDPGPLNRRLKVSRHRGDSITWRSQRRPHRQEKGKDGMAGIFELVTAEQGGVRIHLVSGTGSVLAVSARFQDNAAAAAGVTEIREHAATAHITDRTQAEE